jgi:hypothetical protein
MHIIFEGVYGKMVEVSMKVTGKLLFKKGRMIGVIGKVRTEVLKRICVFGLASVILPFVPISFPEAIAFWASRFSI